MNALAPVEDSSASETFTCRPAAVNRTVHAQPPAQRRTPQVITRTADESSASGNCSATLVKLLLFTQAEISSICSSTTPDMMRTS